MREMEGRGGERDMIKTKKTEEKEKRRKAWAPPNIICNPLITMTMTRTTSTTTRRK